MVDVKVAASKSPSGQAVRIRRSVATLAEAETLELATRKELLTGACAEEDRRVLARVSGGPRTLSRALLIAWHHPTRGWGLPTSRSGKSQHYNARDVIDIVGPNRKCSSIGVADFERAASILRSRSLAPATLTRKLQGLYRVLWFAEQAGWITSRPTWVRPMPTQPRQFIFSPRLEAEVLAFFDGPSGHPAMADLFRLGVDTGARLGELLAIRPADAELGNRYLRLRGPEVAGIRATKNGETRIVVLVDRAVATLRRRLDAAAGGGRLFYPLNSTSVARFMRMARAELDRPDNHEFVFHATRHTCGTRMAEAQVSLLHMMEQLGHKTASMTQRYVKMSPAARRAAILGAMQGD